MSFLQNFKSQTSCFEQLSHGNPVATSGAQVCYTGTTRVPGSPTWVVYGLSARDKKNPRLPGPGWKNGWGKKPWEKWNKWLEHEWKHTEKLWIVITENKKGFRIVYTLKYDSITCSNWFSPNLEPCDLHEELSSCFLRSKTHHHWLDYDGCRL